MVKVVISIVLFIAACICSYMLGYIKKGLNISEARLKVCEDLKTELDKYTDETFDEKTCAFFRGAHWTLDRLTIYEEDLFDAKN